LFIGAKPHTMIPNTLALRVLLISLFLAACTAAPVHLPELPRQPDDPSVLLIQEGERLMAEDDFDKALDRFSEYLGHYPDGPYADLALNRLGAIYGNKGMVDVAQAFYNRLINEYPDSPLADEARLALIDLLISDGQPEAAIIASGQLLDTEHKIEIRRQVWKRLNKVAETVGMTTEAAWYTYMLYVTAEDDEKAQLSERLAEYVERMEFTDIEALWERMDDSYARSLLMYRYAVLHVVMENYDEALGVLTVFRDVYPTHRYAQQAEQVIESLEQRLAFVPQTLGCLLPLSGPYKLYGQRVLNGIELALSLFNSGEQTVGLRLLIEDSAADDTTSVRGVRRLVDAGAGVIIGPIVSAQAAAKEAQRLHIPMVTFTQKKNIAATGDFIFRHFITPQSQVHALVSYFVNGVGLRDFGVLYPDEPYGQTFMRLFLDEVARQGGHLTAIERYDPKHTDFAVPIRKLVGLHHDLPEAYAKQSLVRIKEAPYYEFDSKADVKLEDLLPDPMSRLTGLFFQDPDQDRVKGPAIGRQQELETFAPDVDFDVLFIPDAPKTAGLILPQLAYYDIKDIYLAGTNLWHSPQLIEMARQYAQSAVMVDGFLKDGTSPVVQQFVAQYRKLYDKEPGVVEAFAFDTAWILFNTMLRPGMHFRHVLRDALLLSYETNGVTGPTAFNENGEAVKSLSLLRVKGNRFLEIQ
jgi:ABC-type branched-subunit amino acid transport system substrate-binding protein/TolA-binding protein